MIDFENSELWKLRPVKDGAFEELLRPMFVDGEELIQCFQTVRDGIVFTYNRIFDINIQGVTGRKKDFTILPYSKIQVFSVETAGVLDLDSELDLWFSGLGRVRFEFISNANVTQICKCISEHVL